ncbi:hypothetical protein EDD18DRAFT_1355920 [Armillaria luteobubalina]|uniref:Myb/SANT-like domain-containing protein n=1 Tax=Armillaria luteobubalina TaxID=153913 RepID=A0AA39UUY4_9AGAR|nr:hypothetical protein EDD18DRAFT_1355920 [Armillaria luteobubalina]
MGRRPSNKGSNTPKDGDQHSSTVRRPRGHPKSTQNMSQSQDGSIQSTDRSEAITTAHDNASWTPVDVECMLKVLESHKAAAGDGVSFKAVVWNAVVEECNKVLTEGGRKTAVACKNKYGQLVRTFNIICNIKRVSGWHWSDETGASINAESTSTWDDYAHKHKGDIGVGDEVLADIEVMGDSQDAEVASQPSIDGCEGSQDWDDSFIASQHSVRDDDDETQESALQTIQPLTPAPLTHKCSALSLGKTPVPEKHTRYTPSQQMGQHLIKSVTASMDSFEQSIKEALAPTGRALLEATPHCTQKAMKRAQDLEDWLSTSQMVSLMTIFEKDSWAADAYVVLEREDVRKAWVQRKLKSVPSDESDPFNAV